MTEKRTKVKPKRNNDGTLFFSDYPEFTPNLSPEDIFRAGSFGGTYWRPIYSSICDKKYKNQHKKFPASWWKDIPDKWLITPFNEYDIKINKFKVKVGTTLQFWEEKGWIREYDPYGWIQWYCNFYLGRRTPDDERQIARWTGLAGPNGRFRKFLITLILRKNAEWNDEKISPKIRQTLQHWGYHLTKKDFDKECKLRENRKKK